MKIAHWVLGNGSGMFRVAESLVKAEVALGLDSRLILNDKNETWVQADGVDIHVSHTHIPDPYLYSGAKIVWIGHGTPEVMLRSTYQSAVVRGTYGHEDAFMLAQYWLQHSDALVTFWPRHQRIWQSLCDKHTRVDLVELGIDKQVWNPAQSMGKYSGTPSVFTAENAYEIKWPLDLFILWPWVVEDSRLHGARLHAVYIPKDQHQVWWPLINRNGCSFAGFISPITLDVAGLRNAFASTDFYIGLVRYGDFDKICLEAKACGAKVISYRGNEYADYWITEGDQRDMADELIKVLVGQTEPRQTKPVPDISQTAQEMKAIYERL